MTTLEEEAKKFATYHHGNISQVRKYTYEPYITHPEAVAEIVRSVPHTEAMLCAAWLHDTVEDTFATIEDIYFLFGVEVGNLVGGLTDVSEIDDGNREVRKAKDLKHTAKLSAPGQTIKLADLIHNTSSIVQYDKTKFCEIYLKEKLLLLEVLKRGDVSLWKRAYDQVTEGLKIVKARKLTHAKASKRVCKAVARSIAGKELKDLSPSDKSLVKDLVIMGLVKESDSGDYVESVVRSKS
jgi:hypothetical protein